MQDYQDFVEIGRGSFATVFKARKRSNKELDRRQSSNSTANTHTTTASLDTTHTTITASNTATGASSSVTILQDSIVAIKVVNRLKLNRNLAQNLELEIGILKRSRHRNVVALFNVLKTDKEINLIMEYCSLGDLSFFIKKKGQVPGMNQTLVLAGPWGGLDEFVLRYLMAQLSCAMEFLRFNQIVHRDLKPQNILLTLDTTQPGPRTNQSLTAQKISLLPLLKLGDFGFARVLESESMASTLCGSPLYMAPEILKSEKYDAKADLWSIGAIIYEMVTGRPPFRAQNHIELLRKIERGDGWIRFPDESLDEYNSGFQTKEYHSNQTYQRPQGPSSLVQRKNLASVMNNGAGRVGSLGSSPGTIKVKSPIPEDLKGLVRRLLKRNPVERMGFEEFFVFPAILDARKLDPRLLESPASQSQSIASTPPTRIKKNPELSKSDDASSTTSSNSYHQAESKSLSIPEPSQPQTQIISITPQMNSDPFAEFKKRQTELMDDTSPLAAPFPVYGHDPNWSQKLVSKTSNKTNTNIINTLESIKSVAISPLKFEAKEPILHVATSTPLFDKTEPKLDRLSKKDTRSSNTFTSFGSSGFSSKGANEPKEPEVVNDDDEFVVVESPSIEVKWNPDHVSASTTPLGNPQSVSPVRPVTAAAISSWSQPFQSFPRALSSSLIYGSPHSGSYKSASPSSLENKVVTHPKARLFGSLRADSSFVQQQTSTTSPTSVPPFDPALLLDILPFKIDLFSLKPTDKNALQSILVYLSRAFCISSLADHKWNELDNAGQTPSSTITSQQWQSMSNDVFQLLIFSIGLYHFALNQAKELWKLGPTITKTGFSFSSSPPDTQPLYLAHLSTLVSFSQTNFNHYLERAERLQQIIATSSALNQTSIRTPHRIIYEIALATCKQGAMAELAGQGGREFYKTSILMLHSIMQPSWEVVETVDKLEEDELKEVQRLLDQIIVRLQRHG